MVDREDAAEMVGRTLALGVLGAVPVGGTALATLVGEVWLPSSQRRAADRMAEISADLEAHIEETQITVDELHELAADPHREELVRRAVQEAFTTADEEHRARCRAALLNGLVGDEDTTLALRFTQLLGVLTPAHFDFLAKLQTTTDTGLPATYLLNHWEDSDTLLRAILDDLDNRGLITRVRTIDANRTIDDGPEPLDDAVGDARVTDLGERLIAYVTMPAPGR